MLNLRPADNRLLSALPSGRRPLRSSRYYREESVPRAFAFALEQKSQSVNLDPSSGASVVKHIYNSS